MQDSTILSWARPNSSAASAEDMALAIIASRTTTSAAWGSGRRALRSISSSRSSGSNEPKLTPIRDGAVELDRHPDDLGEMRVMARAASDVAGIDPVLGERVRAVRKLAQEGVAVVVEVADQRHIDPMDLVKPRADLRHPRGAGAVVDRDRTISDPARASSATWAAVATASAVSVLVIDCTTTGAPPPIVTDPTRHPTLTRRRDSLIAGQHYLPSTVPLAMLMTSFCATTTNRINISAMPTTAARS